MSKNLAPRNHFGFLVLLLTLMSIAPGCITEGAIREDSDEDPEGELLGTARQPLPFGGHDYFFTLTPLNWAQAQANCSASGYNLVSINSAAEEEWLRQQEAVRGGGYWWIGYTDAGFEGIWVWADASPIGYTNWSPNEPNDSLGNEDCAVDNWLDPTTNAKWNDLICTDFLKSICERNY